MNWKFWEKKQEPLEVKKICGIRGEKSPGVLTIDVAVYDQDGNHIPYPVETVELKVTAKLRDTVNRVLSETETESDLAVLELAVLKALQ